MVPVSVDIQDRQTLISHLEEGEKRIAECGEGGVMMNFSKAH